jgi:hypothetical protein
MGSKEGDEYLHHHPVCEVCHREFDDVHELGKHVNQEIGIKTGLHDSEYTWPSSLSLRQAQSIAVLMQHIR